MSNELILQQTNASGRLLPSVFAELLARLAKVHPAEPRGTMHGQELRLVAKLAAGDPAAVAFLLDFVGQGKRVKGTAHGPSAALLSWAFHTLAASLKCTLFDANLGKDIDVNPGAHRDAAVAYLAVYEADVEAARRGGGDDDGAAFLAWLAREEHIALADDTEEVEALAAALPLEDAPALYEMVLESDAVDDVFVSERELTSLLTRFKARVSTPD